MLCFKFVVWSISLPPPPLPSTPSVSAVLCLSPSTLAAFYNSCFFSPPPCLLFGSSHHGLCFFLWTVLDLQCSVGLYMHRFFFDLFIFFTRGRGSSCCHLPAARPYLSPPTQAWPQLVFILLTGINVFISCHPSIPTPCSPPSPHPLCSLSPVSPPPLPHPLSVY